MNHTCLFRIQYIPKNTFLDTNTLKVLSDADRLHCKSSHVVCASDQGNFQHRAIQETKPPPPVREPTPQCAAILQFRSQAVKKDTWVDLVLAFIINLYTQQSKSYFSGYQKYQIMKERQSIRGLQNSFGHKNLMGWGKRRKGRHRRGNIHETTICFRDMGM